MFLRKQEGESVIRLPDGSVLSRADLPDPDTKRWVASRKEMVVIAVTCGLMSRADAIRIYGLSEEEFLSWRNALIRHGKSGLKATYHRRETTNG